MKRKRALELGESSQESIKLKKQKSQICTLQTIEETKDLQLKHSRRKGSKDKSPIADADFIEAGPSTSSNIIKKKKKHRRDINENGDVPETSLLSDSKKKKKNGLQNRADSDSPSDFQPLGHFLNKECLEQEKEDIHLEEPVIVEDEPEPPIPPKKKRGRKPKIPVEEESPTNPSLRHGVLKSSNKKKQIEETFQEKDPAIAPDAGRKKTKKKVRIDETESLKVKKELAEPHFSAKQLPAKIIKSKANKNLTEEVKVSPLTVQTFKKERKGLKKIKSDPELEDEDEQLRENGIKRVSSITSEESDLEVYYINKNAEKEARKAIPPKHSIMMPKEDQLILVQRMQETIPEDDTKSYKYRLQHLDWQNVAFNNYSLEECQKVWTQLLKKVRHYRLLIEITQDVKQVIELNDAQVGRSRKAKSNRKHPDMPKRPLSSYFLYYIRERDRIGKERPDLDTVELNKYISEKYQHMSLEKKQKYEQIASKNREVYKQQMEEFYAKHPEMRKTVIKKEPRKLKEKPPKRPENPYRLFVHAELTREEIAEEDKAEFKEVCREKWLQMPDSRKLGWINLAEEHHTKYEEELKEYMARHPEYTPKPQTHKSFLSRQEIDLKDKFAGKPKKPPGSAYGLFISMAMQSSEISDIPPRERWNYTSTKWKAMKDEEREQYKLLLAQVQEQYEKDFKLYLDSLPEEKRQAEILKNLPKKRKNATSDKPSTSKKLKPKSTRSPSTRGKNTKQKIQNPAPPPRSAYKYFAEKYEGENPKEAWKNLSASEKDKYEEELSAIKSKYIKEFETYLKSLTKEELATFCANRSSQVEEFSSSDESDTESEHGEEESSDDDSTDNSDSENESDEN